MNMEKTETLSYKLDVFEGPLDLLLNLIAKNKLNIYDIPIAELLEQYMAQIHEMQAADMDVASEFLEMAARLVHIKSVSLLPKKEEEAALKQELTGQLLEYQQCKEAAMRLRERFSLDGIVRAQADIPADLTYKRHHKPQELLSAYLSMLGKKKPPEPQKPEDTISKLITRRVVSVASQIVFVLRSLWKKRHVSLKELFRGKNDPSERVAAFLAVLELVKDKRLRVDGDGEDCEIKLMNGGE
ncbi:segregation and condensation protein A [Hominenteromicrobium sp.]|uniref:segregation and condensation protein A n=1 Tax=Hominenteromicrobium sp. TaxID=3073581 RepID=UPI003993187C